LGAIASEAALICAAEIGVAAWAAEAKLMAKAKLTKRMGAFLFMGERLRCRP
jgi:hypothetical protein